MDENVRIHGSIFFLLKKFIISNHSSEIWFKSNGRGNGEEPTFEITSNYPISELQNIICRLGEETSSDKNILLENFGEFLVPDLFLLYKSYLNPDWKTFDVIEHTERVMHGAVRKLNSTANPPILNVTVVNKNLMIVDYFSKRKLAGLAVGIIRGIAKFYNEQNKIVVKSMSDPDDERVQIRIEALTE